MIGVSNMIELQWLRRWHRDRSFVGDDSKLVLKEKQVLEARTLSMIDVRVDCCWPSHASSLSMSLYFNTIQNVPLILQFRSTQM